jgi:hypothetical protein
MLDFGLTVPAPCSVVSDSSGGYQLELEREL